MTASMFATTGEAPRVQRVEALAFHDAAGRIRHMHHHIVLESAEPRPYETMVDEVRAQARNLGIDLSKLSVLHVTMPFNPAAEHRVDVKKRVLIELRPPARARESPAIAARRTPVSGARQRKRRP